MSYLARTTDLVKKNAFHPTRRTISQPMKILSRTRTTCQSTLLTSTSVSQIVASCFECLVCFYLLLHANYLESAQNSYESDYSSSGAWEDTGTPTRAHRASLSVLLKNGIREICCQLHVSAHICPHPLSMKQSDEQSLQSIALVQSSLGQ